mmetsp:Transcript_4103/g.10277  ORF Transcript_4103/g.10277 Transcript_4103/m.10277 type:complete len:210 (-) Transcript_4103:310-939(-)
MLSSEAAARHLLLQGLRLCPLRLHPRLVCLNVLQRPALQVPRHLLAVALLLRGCRLIGHRLLGLLLLLVLSVRLDLLCLVLLLFLPLCLCTLGLRALDCQLCRLDARILCWVLQRTRQDCVWVRKVWLRCSQLFQMVCADSGWRAVILDIGLGGHQHFPYVILHRLLHLGLEFLKLCFNLALSVIDGPQVHTQRCQRRSNTSWGRVVWI